MQAQTLLRLQARANRLANRRLHAAMAPLTPSELQAPRSSFFPALMATLNHILAVDRYYVGALHGEPNLAERWAQFVPAADLAALAEQQRASDERLIVFCDALDEAACGHVVDMPRQAGRVQRDAAAHVLSHLFMHQIHHRGQVHAMLSGTRIAPPQLDEFLMPSEAHLRGADMASLGWSESAVYGASGVA
jgi:uncharacterized damage-inducible protein DinB